MPARKKYYPARRGDIILMIQQQLFEGKHNLPIKTAETYKMTDTYEVSTSTIMDCQQCNNESFAIFLSIDESPFPWKIMCTSCGRIIDRGDTPYTALRNALESYYERTALAEGARLRDLSTRAARYLAICYGLE